MILTKEIAQNKLRRMAMEIAERNHNKRSLVLIGIKENGIVIAQIIANMLSKIFDGKINLISLSMDKSKPTAISLSEEIDFNDANILLIDDVANSGRTMLYALKPLLETHPAQIQTLALVERTHKLFPIAVDYVGHSVATHTNETIIVKVENGEVLGAELK
ncbi:MAG TPA: phosphoribosyltransferase family protein [Ferruginibacter sp.]|nr:phosphoribosyltransferase family protein [Ferruginibacter sp.]